MKIFNIILLILIPMISHSKIEMKKSYVIVITDVLKMKVLSII